MTWLEVVLFGESFGGLLSLAVALRMGAEAFKGLRENGGESLQVHSDRGML